ncbi:MAG: leucine-rich repeat domain-containing protein [Clostridiales bacterium]|nr:leucine-rich repeat domain-containing protein [Clostridiales bacterium]
MKKSIIALLMLIVLLTTSLVHAEESQTVSYLGQFKADVNAEYINMDKTRVTDMDAFINFLRKLPNLKKVDMFSTQIYTKDIDKLAAAFPDIEFGWTMRIGDHWVRTDATAFSTLHNNSSPAHTEKQFQYLKYCKNLLALDIGHNGVKDLSFLYDLPNLKVLILACNINLKDITPVGSLKDLEYLELFKNDINDISCLANCTNLLDLNICFNRIKDWTPIHGLTNLERLWVYNSNNWSEQYPVDRKVVADLKAALPNCHIDSTSYSTLGGWREHDRYYVIFHMFKYGEYIPFHRSQEIKQKYPNGINLN